jgi:L-rhamnose isomerase / sugar isomerase
LLDAYETDIRPLLAKVREEKGLHPDPIAAHKASDYTQRIAEDRGSAASNSAGYPTS